MPLGGDNWEDDFKATDKGWGRTGAKQIFEQLDPLNYFFGGKRNDVMNMLGNTFGEDFKGNISWEDTAQDRDVYSQMDAEQWEELSKLTSVGQRNWIKQRGWDLANGRGRPRGKFQSHRNSGQPQQDDAAGQGQANDEAAFQQWKMNKMRELDAFSKQMGMSVDQLIAAGDAGVMSAGNEGRSQAGAASFGAGLGQGGISTMNSQRAVADAQQRYQMGRQQLGLQANTELLNQMGQMGRESEDMRRYDNQMGLQMQQMQEAARQRNHAEGLGKQQSLFGLAGGVIGGVYGGPQGAALGYNLGSGLGGMGYKPYKAQTPTYPNSRRTSYGLGGNFQGSQ